MQSCLKSFVEEEELRWARKAQVEFGGWRRLMGDGQSMDELEGNLLKAGTVSFLILFITLFSFQ